MTLTSFRMNTYPKPGGRGYLQTPTRHSLGIPPRKLPRLRSLRMPSHDARTFMRPLLGEFPAGPVNCRSGSGPSRPVIGEATIDEWRAQAKKYLGNLPPEPGGKLFFFKVVAE